MRRSFKIAAAAAALAMPTSLAAVSLSGTAGASPTQITCSKLSGNINGTIKLTGSKCKAKPPKGYGNISFSAQQLEGGGTITWTGGGTITVTAPNTTSPGQGACKHGYTEEDSTGNVTGGTDTGSNTYDTNLIGTSYSSQTCFNNAGKISLVKKTKFTL